MECFNCGFTYEGNYCPNCGYKTEKDRYNPKVIVKETIDSLGIHSGIFRTTYLLFKNPGPEIIEHIERKGSLYSPFKLLIITGAIATLISFRYQIFDGGSLPLLDLPNQVGYTYYSTKYFSFTNFVGIPLFALATWVVYRKHAYNYAEHLVLNVFIGCVNFYMIILFAPIIVLSDFKIVAVGSLFIASTAYNIWVLITFFQDSMFKGLIKSGISIILGYILAYFTNYGLFRILPDRFLEILEML